MPDSPPRLKDGCFPLINIKYEYRKACQRRDPYHWQGATDKMVTIIYFQQVATGLSSYRPERKVHPNGFSPFPKKRI